MRTPLSRGLAGIAGLVLLAAAGCARPASEPAAAGFAATAPVQQTTTTAPTTPPATSTSAATVPATASTRDSLPTAPVPAPTAATGGADSATSYRRVQTSGLAFDVPSTWASTGDPGVFQDPVTKATLGVNVVPWSPGMEPTSVLPNHSVVTGRTVINLSWGSGEEYRLERSAPAAGGSAVTGYETHVLVRLGSKSILDIYSAALAGVDPAGADQARAHLLQRVALLGG